MTLSNGNMFYVTGHLCGESTGPRRVPLQRPVTWSFDVFFDLRLNKLLSKKSQGWWFETPSSPLWLHCNEQFYLICENGLETLSTTRENFKNQLHLKKWKRIQIYCHYSSNNSVRKSLSPIYFLLLNSESSTYKLNEMKPVKCVIHSWEVCITKICISLVPIKANILPLCAKSLCF